MDNLPTITKKTKLGNTLDKILSAIRRNKIVKSNDLVIEETPNGTIINLKESLKGGSKASEYKGEFDPDVHYSKGQIVRVMPNTNYVDKNGEGDVVPATVGVWICVEDVPDRQFSDMVSGMVGYTSYIRQPTVKYYPQYPEPTQTKDDVVNETDPVVKASIRYWEIISLLPTETSMCDENGNSQTYYVDSVMSGSAG